MFTCEGCVEIQPWKRHFEDKSEHITISNVAFVLLIVLQYTAECIVNYQFWQPYVSVNDSICICFDLDLVIQFALQKYRRWQTYFVWTYICNNK